MASKSHGSTPESPSLGALGIPQMKDHVMWKLTRQLSQTDIIDSKMQVATSLTMTLAALLMALVGIVKPAQTLGVLIPEIVVGIAVVGAVANFMIQAIPNSWKAGPNLDKLSELTKFPATLENELKFQKVFISTIVRQIEYNRPRIRDKIQAYILQLVLVAIVFGGALSGTVAVISQPAIVESNVCDEKCVDPSTPIPDAQGGTIPSISGS